LIDFEFPEAKAGRSTTSNVGGTPELPYAKILATASALPDKVVSNQDIIDAYGHRVAATAIRKMVGVAERRVAPFGVADTDLLALAARRCLDEAQMRPEQLSKLIVTKFLGDRALPMTAALLQKKMGFDVAVQAFDVDGGTHSFLQALHVADCAIGCGDGPVLIVSGGIVNCLISKTDPRLAFQFGDGAAAVLLAPANQRHILANYGFSNYDYIDLALGFSVRDCVTEDMYETGAYQSLFELYDEKDFKRCKEFVTQAMVVTADALLKDAGKNLADVDLFLVTENHPRIWDAIVECLGIASDRTLSLRAQRGNTMSAMLPMLLDEAIRTGKAKPGDLLMLLSLGEGLSGGGVLIEL
jgi:3-oxoacyl-[acyl-carrier-protein] synthase-3